MAKLIFTARVQKLKRIAIPRIIYEELNIKPGDLVEVEIRKVKLKEKERIISPRK